MPRRKYDYVCEDCGWKMDFDHPEQTGFRECGICGGRMVPDTRDPLLSGNLERDL